MYIRIYVEKIEMLVLQLAYSFYLAETGFCFVIPTAYCFPLDRFLV
jgi:hypothetical protein